MDNPLVKSHVIPSFVFKWLKTRSGSGLLRNTENPNARKQDGPKLELLCKECEGLLSKDESTFSAEFFNKLNTGVYELNYEEWLLRFCVSVSWRVLVFSLRKIGRENYSTSQLIMIDDGEATWRKYLLKQIPHPGKFEQHLMLTDYVQGIEGGVVPANLNQYLVGAVDMDIVNSDKTVLTYVKMGRVIIFGYIECEVHNWQNTKVHLKSGKTKVATYKIPIGIIEMIFDRAKMVKTQMVKLSESQQEIITNIILDDPRKFLKSETGIAALYDYNLAIRKS